MPRIRTVERIGSGKYRVTVRPDGNAAASGILLDSDEKSGHNAQEVGTWSSPADQDGVGEAATAPGKWLFAEQTVRSQGFPIPAVDT